MRKWYRLYPTVLAVGIGAALIWAVTGTRSFGQAGALPAKRIPVKAFDLPPQLPIATGYTAVDAFSAQGGPQLTFVQPLDIVAPPGEKDRLFIVSKTGTIDVVTDLDGKNGGPKKSQFMDLNPYLRAKGWTLGQQVEWGLLGLAFHPKFKENGCFYITYSPNMRENNRNVGFDRLARFSVSKDDPNKADMTSELPLFTQYDEAPNHNGGCIIFGQDGYLYTSIGDEGNANDSFDNARWIDKDFFAAIFRLDVDRRPENLEPNPHTQTSTNFPSAINMVDGHAAYKVPADNPLVGITEYFGRQVDPKKVRTEMYANGLRNS
ncbi:MAG TPA: PQQ-dependent sugar dehydrogenase, partial [Phycisphaerae bacterium]